MVKSAKAKKKKASVESAQTKKAAGKKVWHVTDFRQRFELPDSVRMNRKRPLEFTKEYVGSGKDDDTILYAQQLEALPVCQKAGFHLLCKGVFRDIRERAANRSSRYRGYLLDECLQPASEAKIAAWLRIDRNLAARALRALEKVGLIEKVDVPAFEPPATTPPEDAPVDDTKDETPRKKKTTTKRKKATGTGKKAEKTESSENLEKPRKTSENLGSPLKNGNGNGKPQLLTANGNGEQELEQKTATAQAAPGLSEREQEHKHPNAEAEGLNGQQDNHKANGRPNHRLYANRGAEGQCQGETASTPSAAPPMPTKPTGADAGGALTKTGTDAGGGSGLHPDPSASHSDKLWMYDPQEFAGQVYLAIREPHAPDTTEGRREMGNYHAAWCVAVDSGLKPSELERLWKKSVAEATTLGNRRQRHGVRVKKSHGAIWRSVFNKRLRAMKGANVAAG